MFQQKKKIIYLITKSNQGGAQRNVYDLATNLSHNDYDAVIFAGGNGWLIEEARKKNIRARSLSFLSRDINIISDISVFFNLFSLFKKEKPDIAHLHSSKVGGLGALAARFAGVKKIIFTVHGWAFNEPRFFLTRTALWLVSWLTALFSHSIITITKKDTAQARAMPFVPQSKIHYIPNDIGDIEFLPRAEAREMLIPKYERKLSQETIWIGTISELTKNKGLLYAIDAIVLLKTQTNIPFIFLIIGEGEEHDAIMKKIKKNNLSDTVFLVGHKKNASILLKAFDIFTLTSLKEGLPYVLLEARRAALPIVASNIGGIPDIVNDKIGILVPPKNHKAIAKALLLLMEKRDDRNIFEEKDAVQINKTHSLQKMIDAIKNLYK